MKVGGKVRLKANVEEGWAEETGTLLDLTSTYATVQLDVMPDREEGDDGLRDVTLDQLEAME